MKVILLTDVPKVGNRDEIKELKDGFAQNVLIAKGLAIMATPKELALLEKKKRERKEKIDSELEVFESAILSINNQNIEIKAKANEKGHLFKAINSKDVAFAIKKKTGIEIEEDSIWMSNIKEVGLHNIEIKKGNKKGQFKIKIEKE